MIKEKEMELLHVSTPKKDRKYRVGSTFDYNGEKFGNMLCYVDARYVMDMLDSVVGAANWDSEFFEIKGRLYCKLTVRYLREDGSIGSTYKMDCGTEGNIEKEKAETSDALKRASVQFGISRDLYSMPNIQKLYNKKYRKEFESLAATK